MKKFMSLMALLVGVMALAGCCCGGKSESKPAKKVEKKHKDAKHHDKKAHDKKHDNKKNAHKKNDKQVAKKSDKKANATNKSGFDKMCNECGNVIGECTCNL